jgi:hypothetical protein
MWLLQALGTLHALAEPPVGPWPSQRNLVWLGAHVDARVHIPPVSAFYNVDVQNVSAQWYMLLLAERGDPTNCVLDQEFRREEPCREGGTIQILHENGEYCNLVGIPLGPGDTLHIRRFSSVDAEYSPWYLLCPLEPPSPKHSARVCTPSGWSWSGPTFSPLSLEKCEFGMVYLAEKGGN